MVDFCLIGAGFIGPVHARNIAAHPRARLRFVVDLDAGAAQRLADLTGAAVASLDEALATSGLDAVVISTPPRSHADAHQARRVGR